MNSIKPINRLSFWVARRAESALALQACIPQLFAPYVATEKITFFATIGLAIVSLLIANARRLKEHGRRTNDTASYWSLAAAGFGSASLFVAIIPESASFALTSALTGAVCLLLFERHCRRRSAFTRVRRRRQQHHAWQATRKSLHKQWDDRLRWLAGIQHDMRQPLQALGLLILNPTIQKDKRLASVVQQMHGCQRWLYELAENTLDATKMQLGEANDLSIEPISLESICQSVGSWIMPLAESKNIALNLPTSNAHMVTHSRRLKRVLVNLLHNAIRHTDTGSVELCYNRIENLHCFEIIDTGPGLPVEVAEDLRRYRTKIDATLPKRGLGLYVAQNFCAEQGWSLEIVKTDPTGTHFRLMLKDEVQKKAAPTLKRVV